MTLPLSPARQLGFVTRVSAFAMLRFEWEYAKIKTIDGIQT